MEDPDAVLLAEFLNRFGHKLGPIIRNNRIRDAEARDDILPKKSLYVSSSYSDKGLGLHPLGVVVCRRYQVLEPCRSRRQLSYYVQTPLREGPKAGYRV